MPMLATRSGAVTACPMTSALCRRQIPASLQTSLKGSVLIVLASAFFFLRAVGTTHSVGVGAAATLLGCAMLVVAAGSLLPSVEDWFGARHELRTIQPLLTELGRRHPDIGIGVRPRGPLVFRVAERMSLISDALFLEATAADNTRKRRVDATASAAQPRGSTMPTTAGLESPSVPPQEQARAIAQWIYDGREDAPKDDGRETSPAWRGCASRARTRTANGSSRSRSSTAH